MHGDGSWRNAPQFHGWIPIGNAQKIMVGDCLVAPYWTSPSYRSPGEIGQRLCDGEEDNRPIAFLSSEHLAYFCLYRPNPNGYWIELDDFTKPCQIRDFAFWPNETTQDVASSVADRISLSDHHGEILQDVVDELTPPGCQIWKWVSFSGGECNDNMIEDNEPKRLPGNPIYAAPLSLP
jgi:hypothetical protein